ncbi:integral membrane protein [Fusarium oxysporum f. sp. phaseoli]
MIVRIPQIKSVALTSDFLYSSITLYRRINIENHSNLAIFSIVEPCLGILGGSAASLALAVRTSLNRNSRRPSTSPVRLRLYPGTTTIVNGGRGHSTDFGPPAQGIGVSSRVTCTRERLSDELMDYHDFLATCAGK